MRHTIFFLVITSFGLNAQIRNFDSISKEYFNRYEIIFIGEQHKILSTESIEIKLLSLIKDQKTKVCLELPFDVNIPIEITYSGTDTVNYNLSIFIKDGKDPYLFKFLFNNKLFPTAIDVLQKKYFYKKAILDIYNSKTLPNDIKKDIDNFASLGDIVFPNELKNMSGYMHFMTDFCKKRTTHAVLLEEDSSKVIGYFDALDAMLFTESNYGKDGPLMTNYREEFMFKMLKKEIDNMNNNKVIAINGNAHIHLDNKSKWIKDKSFISLGARVKTAYPEKNIASIYLMYRDKDLYFKKSYPEEYKFIMKQTQSGKEYLIEINDSNIPFKNLIGKYTHIVVY
jgi:hypothetical protein